MQEHRSSRLSFRHFGFGVALLALAVGGVELGARALGFGHPLLYRAAASGYEVAPGQVVVRLGKVTRINALGTRGSEAAPVPAAGTVRILALGDSVTHGGSQSNDEETYPALLAAALKGRKVEVLNASAGGWAVQNEAGWLASHGLLGASIVVLEINEKDLDQGVAEAVLDSNPSFPSHRPATALGEIWSRYALPRLGLAQAADPGSQGDSFAAGNVAQVQAGVERIAAQVKRAGGRLVLLYWDPRELRPEAESARQHVFAWGAREGVVVVRPQLNRRGDAGELFRDAIHPNPRGNAMIAAQLAQVLQPMLR